MRRDKVIGSSLEAEVGLELANPELVAAVQSVDFDELCIVSASSVSEGEHDRVAIARTEKEKCGRCWRHLPEVDEVGALCARCDEVVNG